MPKAVAISVEVTYDTPFKTPPRIKIIEPKSAAITKVTEKFFSFKVYVNPISTWELKVSYTADFKELHSIVSLQFCPACREPLSTWPEFRYAGFQQDGKIVPSVPIGLCPICGNTFISRLHLKQMTQAKESKIIRPAGVIIGRK